MLKIQRGRTATLVSLLMLPWLGLVSCATTTPQKLDAALRWYRDQPGNKAFALALDLSGAAAWGHSSGRASVEEAKREALERCQGGRPLYMVQADCALYAINDRILNNSESETTSQPSTSPEQTRQPESFGVSRVLFRIPTGRRIGTHYERDGRPGVLGLITVPRSSYVWEGETSFGRPEELRLAAIEELKSQGLPVLGAESVLFGEDRGWKARYQLGGEVSEVVFNTYAPAFKAAYSEASMAVNWQLFDPQSERIVFSTRTVGDAKVGGVTREVVLLAFRSAARQLASGAGFSAVLRQNASNAAEAVKKTGVLSPECDPGVSPPLPQGLDKVMDGVVVVRAGAVEGSGFLISSDGYIVTAAHVVSGLDRVAVTLRSGLELDGQVTRFDNSQDVALLKVPGRGYKCLLLDSAATLAAGTEVYAIGAPRGMKYSVSKGIVSGMREIESKRYLQTDASLNPGSSGGPLVEPGGRVVAMVSWKIRGSEGLAFGVPVDSIRTGLEISAAPLSAPAP